MCKKVDDTHVITKSDTFTDIRDGKTYETVKIGDQVWMAENLNYFTITGSWVHDDSIPNAKTYGRLYNWGKACDVCPFGWHLPTDEEWKEMEITLGMSQRMADTTGYRGTYGEGSKLKSTFGWSNNGNGTNLSGFNALPAGIHYYENNSPPDMYKHLGELCIFWTITNAINPHYAAVWVRSLNMDSDKVARSYSNIDHDVGISVRCVKNPDY